VIRYFGSDIPVRLNDAVKMKRWLRWVDGAVVYIPLVSPPNAFFGKDSVGILTHDQNYYGILVGETGEALNTLRFLARVDGPPPEVPDDLDQD
jgi:hypothetical protein